MIDRKQKKKKKKRPTMEEKESEVKLRQLYKNLEDKWDNIKQSKLRTLRGCSTDSSIIVKTLSLLENSPRALMTSLQHRKSPSDDQIIWKVRTNDLAVMEILRERRAAIESGKLKGRRLFDEAEFLSEVGFGGRQDIYTDWNGLIEDCEVRSVTSYDSDDVEGIGASDADFLVCNSQLIRSYSSSSSTSPFNEVFLKEGEKKVVEEVEHKRGVSGGCTWKLMLLWVAVALVVSAVCIRSVISFSGYRNEDHAVILVPT